MKIVVEFGRIGTVRDAGQRLEFTLEPDEYGAPRFGEVAQRICEYAAPHFPEHAVTAHVRTDDYGMPLSGWLVVKRHGSGVTANGGTFSIDIEE